MADLFLLTEFLRSPALVILETHSFRWKCEVHINVLASLNTVQIKIRIVGFGSHYKLDDVLCYCYIYYDKLVMISVCVNMILINIFLHL